MEQRFLRALKCWGNCLWETQQDCNDWTANISGFPHWRHEDPELKWNKLIADWIAQANDLSHVLAIYVDNILCDMVDTEVLLTSMRNEHTSKGPCPSQNSCGEHMMREVVSHTCVLTIPCATFEVRKETHKVYDWFDVSRTGLMIKLIFFSQPMMENSVASCRRLLRVTVNIGASKSREMRLQSLRSTRFHCYSPENIVKLRSAGSLDTNVPG